MYEKDPLFIINNSKSQLIPTGSPNLGDQPYCGNSAFEQIDQEGLSDPDQTRKGLMDRFRQSRLAGPLVIAASLGAGLVAPEASAESFAPTRSEVHAKPSKSSYYKKLINGTFSRYVTLIGNDFSYVDVDGTGLIVKPGNIHLDLKCDSRDSIKSINKDFTSESNLTTTEFCDGHTLSSYIPEGTVDYVSPEEQTAGITNTTRKIMSKANLNPNGLGDVAVININPKNDSARIVGSKGILKVRSSHAKFKK